MYLQEENNTKNYFHLEYSATLSLASCEDPFSPSLSRHVLNILPSALCVEGGSEANTAAPVERRGWRRAAEAAEGGRQSKRESK